MIKSYHKIEDYELLVGNIETAYSGQMLQRLAELSRLTSSAIGFSLNIILLFLRQNKLFRQYSLVWCMNAKIDILLHGTS